MKNDQETAGSTNKKKGQSESGVYRAVKDGDLANPIPLNEYLGGVGQMLRLAPKDLPKPPPPPAKFSLKVPAKWTRVALPLAALLLVPFFFKRSPAPAVLPTTLPDGVEGTWITQDPRYAGRRFEIAGGSIAFKNGDRADDQSVHQISAVATEDAGDSTLVRISYLEAKATYELAFKYVRFPTPGIRFAHQEELVWRKMPAAKVQEVNR